MEQKCNDNIRQTSNNFTNKVFVCRGGNRSFFGFCYNIGWKFAMNVNFGDEYWTGLILDEMEMTQWSLNLKFNYQLTDHTFSFVRWRNKRSESRANWSIFDWNVSCRCIRNRRGQVNKWIKLTIWQRLRHQHLKSTHIQKHI